MSSRRVILRGARVVDPGSGHDAVADVHVEDGTITAVGRHLPAPDDRAITEVDVSGLVLGPGFVDLHSHVNSIAGQRLQAMDGVTTALELEAGLLPVDLAYAKAAREGRPLNYGFSASWGAARAEVLCGEDPDADFVNTLAILGNPAWQESSTPVQLRAWLRRLETELADGALGIGILQGYAPRTAPTEFRAVAELAARAGAPTFTHVRELTEVDATTPIDGSTEIAQIATEFGGQMHHCHVNSTSRRHIDRVLDTLETARTGGARVTVEAYPYGAGSTGIGAAFLAPERLPSWGLSPRDLVLLPSGERIRDEAHLRHVREADPGTACIVEFLDEENPADQALMRRSLAFPDSIVASDAMHVMWPDGTWDTREWPLPPGGVTHPRTSGTYLRALRTMVRQEGAWTWLEAFRRCSYLPARVLDGVAPDARGKGHLGVGADADIVVLDPERVTDSATYLDSTRPSVGVRHLLVNGDFVVRDGDVVIDAYPGLGLRGKLA